MAYEHHDQDIHENPHTHLQALRGRTGSLQMMAPSVKYFQADPLPYPETVHTDYARHEKDISLQDKGETVGQEMYSCRDSGTGSVKYLQADPKQYPMTAHIDYEYHEQGIHEHPHTHLQALRGRTGPLQLMAPSDKYFQADPMQYPETVHTDYAHHAKDI